MVTWRSVYALKAGGSMGLTAFGLHMIGHEGFVVVGK
jgi:hypothetical protein